MEAYELIKQLGRGASGEVHLVRRKSDQAQLALKRINYADLQREEKKQTMLEVALLSRLKHPNIIQYIDHFHDGDDLCVVMEAAPDDLLKLLRRHKATGTNLPEEQLLGIMSQVASALHYAHSCRVLHRDVKPANVLLTADGVAKVSDFGISCTIANNELHLGRMLRLRADGTMEGENELAAELNNSFHNSLKGTPAYMAPELFNHKLHVDGNMYSSSSDVWALGVMMFELMAQRLPYEGGSMISIVYKLVNDLSQNALTDERESLDRDIYSSQLCACVEGMLHKRPLQRITLTELLSREVVRRYDRGGDHPPLVDLLVESAKQMSGSLPDCYAHGRGAVQPRLREDLMGLPVVSIACGAAHCAAVTAAGELYTWGKNDCGQLGHGDKHRLTMRRRVLFAEPTTTVRGVACGFAHTLAIADGGSRLFSFGSDKHGQLGLGSGALTRDDVGKALRIDDDQLSIDGISRAVVWKSIARQDVEHATITAVDEFLGGAVTLSVAPSAAASAASAADDADDASAAAPTTLTIGNPDILGLRDAFHCVLSPAPMRTPPLAEGEVWAVLASGEQHSAAITTAGAAYAWGNADDGRLGVEPTPSEQAAGGHRVYAPRQLPLRLHSEVEDDSMEPVPAMVDCGNDFTAFVDEAGSVWGCGANYDGQLGLDEPDLDEVTTLTRLLPEAHDVGVEFVSCGANHMAAADALGRLWVWGGRFGPSPQRVRLPGRDDAPALADDDDDEIEGAECALVACGAEMLLAVSDDGDAYTWGEGSFGRLGLADGNVAHDSPRRLQPLSAPAVRVQMVACGKSVASTDEGPTVLVLAIPEAPEQLTAQFQRFVLTDAPTVH